MKVVMEKLTNYNKKVVPIGEIRDDVDMETAERWRRHGIASFVEKQEADADEQEVVGEQEVIEAPGDYSEMTNKELYKLCLEREIEAEIKKPKQYYVDLLEEADLGTEDAEEAGDNNDDADGRDSNDD